MNPLHHYQIRLTAWRLVSLTSVLLIVVGVFWHRTVIPPEGRALVPPYEVPSAAKKLVTTDMLPDPGDGGWLPYDDAPPDEAPFNSSARYRQDVRERTYTAAWQRSWITADQNSLLRIRLLETRRASQARAVAGRTCAPHEPLALPGAAVAGFVEREDGHTTICAIVQRGRTVVVIGVRAERGRARKAQTVLTEVLRLQAPRIPDSPDLPPVTTLGMSATALNSTIMIVGVGLPAVFGLFTLVRDRSSRRRLRAWLTWQEPRGVFSVEPLASLRLARTTAATLIRLAVYTWAIRLCELTHQGIKTSLGVGVGTVVGVLAVEWLLRRRTPRVRRVQMFQGWRVLIGLAGVTGAVAVAGLGLAFIIENVILLALGLNTKGGSDYVAVRWYVLWCVAGFLLILLAIAPMSAARQLAMRRFRHYRPDLDEPFILLLRSFIDDRRKLRARRIDRASVLERLLLRRFERFEEVTASALSPFGGLVAVDDSRFPPPFGARRISFGEKKWFDGVTDLSARSRIVCMMVGRTESLVDEIRLLRDGGALHRTIFVIPPTDRAEQRERMTVLANELRVPWQVLDRSRPGTEVLAVTFPYGEPVVLTGRTDDDLSYEIAIEIAARVITDDMAGADRDMTAMTRSLIAEAHLRNPVCSGGFTIAQRRGTYFKKNTAPRPRRWYRDPVRRTGVMTAAFLLVPLAFQYYMGYSTDDGFSPYDDTSVRYSKPMSAIVQDLDSPAVYGIFADHYIRLIDFKHPFSSKIRTVTVDDLMTDLVVRGHDLFYVSPTGHAGRVDLTTGRVRWRTPVGSGVTSLILKDDRVYTAAAPGTVKALAAADGHVIATRYLEGAPIALALAEDRIYISLTKADVVARIDPGSLKILERHAVPAAPYELESQGRFLWVHSAIGHVVSRLDPRGTAPPLMLWLTKQHPKLSGNGLWFTVEGLDRITVVTPDGTFRRQKSPVEIAAMLIQPDGTTVVSDISGLVLRQR